jgi:phosphoribosylformylglycinamidine synthase
MWQFAETTRGLADACRELGVPVTGGNVSFYNQTGATAINPTPVVGVLGVIDDVRRRVPIGVPESGLGVYLLGVTRDEFGGSEWAHGVHGHLGGLPPRVDLDAEKRLAAILTSLADTVIAAAHDLSDGGLVQALVESALQANTGITVHVDGDPFVTLFSESAARAIVFVSDEDALEAACEARGVPLQRIGVTGGEVVSVDGLFEIPLDELRTAHEGTLPRLFG